MQLQPVLPLFWAYPVRFTANLRKSALRLEVLGIMQAQRHWPVADQTIRKLMFHRRQKH